jgi:hypothetical protein
VIGSTRERHRPGWITSIDTEDPIGITVEFAVLTRDFTVFSRVGGSFIAPLSLYIAKYVIKAEWVMQ